MPAPNPRRQHDPPPKPPTARQLAYLKALAEKTGQTFAYPRTRVQAGSEIERLKNVAPELARSARSSATTSPTSGPPARRRASALPEITGYGSSATWKERS